MAVARVQRDVLQMFYGPIPREQNRNLHRPLFPQQIPMFDLFVLSQSNFQEWLQVWRMIISEENPNNRDLLVFARENKAKFTNLVENEIVQFQNIKVSFGLQAKFSIDRNEETTQHMVHCDLNI